MPSETVDIQGARSVPVLRRGTQREDDFVVVEEPLEIRVDGKPLVVTMRTPGYDTELAAGFLHAEGIVSGRADILSIHAVDGAPERSTRIKVSAFAGDHVNVTLSDSAATGKIEPAERAFRATAACGVCGKEEISDLEQDLPPVSPVSVDPQLLESLPNRLRRAQQLFEVTGGIHAAGVFGLDGELLCAREDIGRHNAVDKVIGFFVLRNELPLAGRILVVSGRAGFELVQKALKAAMPVMVSVGAASSVAVDMATDAGMTLYSFAGPGTGNWHVKT